VSLASLSRTRKSAWGLASGLVYTAVSLCVGFLATPWLLLWLGPERFGSYRVLLDWFGYLPLLELGLGASLLALLASAIGRSEASAVRNLLWAGLRAYSRVTLGMVAAAVGLVVALPKLVSLELVSSDELRRAGLILFTVFLVTPLSVFRALTEAEQRGYIVNVLLVIQSVLMTGLLLATAWAGWGLVGQSLATVVAQLPAVLILTGLGMRAYPGVWSAVPDAASTKALWALNWPTLAHNISGRIGLLSDNVIVAWVLGPVAVVPFYLTQRLTTMAQAQLQGLGNATWAGLAELHAQGQFKTFRLRLVELTGMVSGLGVAVLGPIAAYNPHFIERWVGPVAFAGEAVNLIACANVWLWSLSSLWGWPLAGTGHIGRWVPYAVVFTLVNVVVSIAGTLVLGLVGPLLGTLVGFLLVSAWALPWVLNQVFVVSPWTLWRAALTPLAWGVPYAAIMWLLARAHTPWGWFGLATEMSLAALGGLALWWTLSLSATDRTLWVIRVRGVLSQ